MSTEAPEPPSSYSIALRVQRTTVEYAYLRIPITEAVVEEQPDGSGRINAEKLVAEGQRMAQSPEMIWYPESQTIEPHPWQQAPSENEQYSNTPFEEPGIG